MDREKIILLGETPVKKALSKLAVPSIIGMLINAVYNMVDTFFIGKLNDESALAAVTIAFPLMLIIGSMGALFGIGGASYLSRLLGNKEYKEASTTTTNIFFIIVFISIVTTSAVAIFIKPILLILGSTETVLPYAVRYTEVIMFANGITMLNMSMSSIMRAEGAARQSMITFLIGTGINIILDPIFILYLGMGIRGAAIATVIGKSVSFIYILYYFYFSGQNITVISPSYFSIHPVFLKEILKIGLPSFARQFLSSMSFGLINTAARHFGDSALAGIGISIKVISISFFLSFGYASGFQPLAGYSWGAKNYPRLMEAIKEGLKKSTLISISATLIFVIFADRIISAFTSVEEVIGYGVPMLKAMAILMPFLGLQLITATLFQSIGRGMPSMILSLSRQGIFYIPSILILPRFLGFTGILISQPVADFFTIIITIILLRNLMQELHELDNRGK